MTKKLVPSKSETSTSMQELMESVHSAVAAVTARPETFTMPAVGKFFGVHPQTCRKWVKRGILPAPAIKVGRTVRWSRAQLEAVLVAWVTA